MIVLTRRADVWAAAALLLAMAACGSQLEGTPPDGARDGSDEVETDAPEVDDDGESDQADATADDVAPETADTGEDDGDAGPETPPGDGDGDAPGEIDDDADADDDGADAAARPCDGIAEGGACDDGDLCTLGDRCVAGQCLPESALACDDGNVCTDDTCRPEVGCVHLHNLATCEDGDPCTTADRCSVGICRPGRPACDDLNPCTRDRCDPDGSCTNTPDDSLTCEDLSACTAGDFCAGGVCVSGLGDGCAEDDPCVSLLCSADGLACELKLLDGSTCDDGDACTVDDNCQGGLCRAGSALACPWDTECAAFRCDRQEGCLLDTVFQAGKACSDDDRCTLGESCDGEGVCAPIEPAECDDANVCTEDSCDARWGCQHTWVDGACDDKSRCTFDDKCQFGQCGGTAVSCDDGDACTLDSCDPLLGCQHLAIACDDHNPCTADSCDRATGCRYAPVSGSCDDGLACTVMESCVAGVCVPAATTCGDDDPCTVDVCDAEEGCVNVPLDPCPVDALRISAVGVTDDPSGLGQWIAIANDSDEVFDLEGYAIHGDGCDCEAFIDDSVVVPARATVYGLRASSPSPLPAELAPGGPATASGFDFSFGDPGDGFHITGGGDRVELVSPGGDLVDAFVVPP